MSLAALSTPAVIAIAAGVVVLAWVVRTFNSFIRLRNKVRESFSGIDVQLKRRHDLVPNLVKVVKAYAKHERETLEEVVEARNAASDASEIPDRVERENGLSRSLDRLIALVESYPDLKADGNFRKLHTDLVEIEDDLQYARRYYNGTVRDLNTRVQQVPANVLAGLFGVAEEPFFEIADATERHAPTLSWDDAATP